ncbi:MAG: DUF4224 domain-containing protein [Magnetococcales bacterium]|nr:DUF4224 domain-containing protein [Magnetococcales bacterium]
MENSFLSRQEIQGFTGYTRKADVRRHLKKQGIKFFEDREGWPIVSRAFLEYAHLSREDGGPLSPIFQTEPNMEFLK